MRLFYPMCKLASPFEDDVISMSLDIGILERSTVAGRIAYTPNCLMLGANVLLKLLMAARHKRDHFAYFQRVPTCHEERNENTVFQ